MMGAVCASDTDHTIYQLSKSEPLAIAVNSYSIIPWEDIINCYKSRGPVPAMESLDDYVNDFMMYLLACGLEIPWDAVSETDRELFFMGYGQDDMFPSIAKYRMIEDITEDPSLELVEYYKIDQENRAGLGLLGNLDSVSTLLWGMSDEMAGYIAEAYDDAITDCACALEQKFMDTKHGPQVQELLMASGRIPNGSFVVENTRQCALREVLSSLATYSIENMVMAAETIVNTEVRLDHLKQGGKEQSRVTREIAILTRAEGLTWIKHGLYAL